MGTQAPAPADPKTDKQIGRKPKAKKPASVKLPYRHPAYYAPMKVQEVQDGTYQES